MNYGDPFDSMLFDEENSYTQQNDLWDDYFAEHRDEIDERPQTQADGTALRNELNMQVSDMLARVLTEEESDIVRLSFGIGCRRHTMEEIGLLYESRTHAEHIYGCALEKLRCSDEIIYIYKYLNNV